MSVREWAAAQLNWMPVRNGVKYAVHRYARVRGRALERRDAVPEVGSIFAAGPQKAGSQWLKALFDHPVVRRHSGLFTLPQLDYKLTPPEHGFPAGTFVPGVYLSYPEFDALPKPHPVRVVYLSRDPRDMVVSGYWSAVKTHPRTHLDEVEAMRRRLVAMSQSDALLEIINASSSILQDMATWIDVDDERVARFRLENLRTDQRGQVVAMLAHTGITLADDELEQLLHDIDRSTLQAKDMARRKDGDSHYRVQPSTHEGVFTDIHHKAMDDIVPGLVQRLGYSV